MAQQRITLPASIVRAVQLVAQDAESSEVDALILAMVATFGYALYSACESIDPTGVAIPEAQWTAIAEALTTVRGPAINRVNYAMDWMNKGPSAFSPCEHAWVAGMMHVADEDVESVARQRPVTCEKCEAPWEGSTGASDALDC